MERVAGTGLTPHGREYFQLRGGLRNAWRRFQAGGSARVVFLGGSITQMAGWRDLVCQQLAARFPQTKFDFVNAGISSTGSTPGAFRLLRDVFSRGPRGSAVRRGGGQRLHERLPAARTGARHGGHRAPRAPAAAGTRYRDAALCRSRRRWRSCARAGRRR